MARLSSVSHKAMEVLCIPALGDNYGWLVRCSATGATASIDTPEAAPLLRAAQAKGWQLSHILNTHHHHDHVGGNAELTKAFTGCTVVGAGHDAHRIPGITQKVQEGDVVKVGDLKAQVIETPGHTTGHICYYFAEQNAVFVGDTLFSLGCGRLFEGTPAMMWKSLSKLAALPKETAVYCAHEYTLNNAKFAVHVDPDNSALAQRVLEIKKLREAGTPTIPSSIGLELATNPFLRPADATLRAHLGMQDAEDVDVFAKVRKMKDSF